MGGNFRGSSEPCLMDSTFVLLDENPDGDSGDQMGKGKIIPNASCAPGGMSGGRSPVEVKYAKALKLAASICKELAGQKVGDVEDCLKEKRYGIPYAGKATLRFGSKDKKQAAHDY